MNFEKSVSLVVVIYCAILITNCLGDNCKTKCGGHEAFTESQKKGEFVCYLDPDPERNIYDATSPCILECKGYTKEEDQTNCFCDVCKYFKDGRAFGFCEEPGKKMIESTECDEQVCSGKAKFFGPACSLN